MTIGLQGTWTVSVASKSAAWQQRFTVAGSTNGADGTYNGVTTTAPVLVTGDQWGVTIENNPTGPIEWRPSRMRLANFRVDGSFFKVDLESDDGGGGDADFNDLILTAAMPLSSSQWVVYGTAKSYSGWCLINPCFPFPWVVIDTPLQLERLLAYPDVRPVLERAYGARVADLANRETFTPMMLPLGGRSTEGLAVKGDTTVELAKKGRSKNAELTVSKEALVGRALSPDYATPFDRAELDVIGKLKFPFACNVEPIAEALLRFVEYDRTDEELAGDPYTGFGDRETLGVTATDEFGNYVFAFPRTLDQIVDEAFNDVPAGGDATIGARPDLIIQFAETPDGIALHETAPYYDIPNVRRIDLCIPADALLPKPCRGDRVLQYLGDIPIVTNPFSKLRPDGTVSNLPGTEAGPIVRHAAWRGTVDIFGCFEGTTTPVTHYTMEVRYDGQAWTYLNVPASGLRQQGTAVWTTESYGADPASLHVNGASLPAVNVPAYRNIELETGWSLYVEHLKARVNVASYLPGTLARSVGTVSFRIRGFDAAGNPVAGAYDTVTMLVDNEPATGEIESIAVAGGGDPGDCALLEIPSAGAPLDIRLRATDPDGFLDAWSLTAVRGSNHAVGLVDGATSGPVGGAYGDAAPFRFHGTSEITGADLDGFVTLSVTPTNGDWLQGEDFCAFSFELDLTDRTTNGKSTPGSRKVWDEVIGMRPAP